MKKYIIIKVHNLAKKILYLDLSSNYIFGKNGTAYIKKG